MRRGGGTSALCNIKRKCALCILFCTGGPVPKFAKKHVDKASGFLVGLVEKQEKKIDFVQGRFTDEADKKTAAGYKGLKRPGLRQPVPYRLLQTFATCSMYRRGCCTPLQPHPRIYYRICLVDKALATSDVYTSPRSIVARNTPVHEPYRP
eukprot:SAG11_NODE_130_length_15497_cov_10.780556_12_plen_151_part_00